MLTVLTTILPIFLTILLGALLRRVWFNALQFWENLEKIIYFLLFPALLISVLSKIPLNYSIVHQAIFAIVLATFVIAIGAIIAQYFFSINHSTFTSYFQGCIRYNTYIFIGIANALYGHNALAIVAIIIAYMLSLTNVLSVLIFNIYLPSKKTKISDVFISLIKNPLIIAIVIGLSFDILNINMGNIINTFLDYLGRSALPLSLLCIGAGFLFEFEARKILSIILISFIKLLILPLLTLLFLYLFHVKGLDKQVAILYASIPTASNAYILSRLLGGDSKLMATIITATVLLSIVTIPIMLYFA